jgi:hypothetical protein
MNSTLEQVEVLDIEHDEMSCQFAHEHAATPRACRTCLVEVTHIAEARCERQPIHLCEAAANAIRTFMAAGPVARCKVCKEPPRTHWTVRPI